MKSAFIRFVKLLFCVVFLVLVVFSVILHQSYSTKNRLSRSESTGNIFISNITIITNNINQPTLRNQNILIENGKITLVSSDVPDLLTVSSNIQFVDGTGKFLLPGLIDAHTHIEDSSYLSLALAHGVTTVRGMRGNERQLKWRDEIIEKKWMGSRFLVSSPILDGEGGDPFHQNVTTVSDARMFVKTYFDDGYDFLKLYGNFTVPVYNEILRTAEEIGIGVSKHGPFPVHGLGFPSLEGLISLEHVEDIYNYEYMQKFNSLNRDRGINYAELKVPIVATLAVYEELTKLSLEKQKYLDSISLEYMNPTHYYLLQELAVNRWLNATEQQALFNEKVFKSLLNLTRDLHNSNVKVLVGSDSGALIGQAGIATLREIELLVKAGISNHSALIAATFDNAVALNLDAELGSIEPGQVADLVILNSNPIEDISSIRDIGGVVFDGIHISSDELELLKTNALKTNSFLETSVGLLADIISLTSL